MIRSRERLSRAILYGGYVPSLTGMGRCLLLVVGMALLVDCGDARALTGDLTNNPVSIVEKFVSLDKRGARIEPFGWEGLKPYMNWDREPVWGRVTVIDDYEISRNVSQWTVVDLLEVVIPVRFRVVGIMYWESATFRSHVDVERVAFRVKAVDNRWRIVEPILPPHVGLSRLHKYVRHAILQETDPTRRERLIGLREALEEATP